MRFSRQGYWRGLLFPSPGDLPNPGIEPRSPVLMADYLPTEPQGKGKLKALQTAEKRREAKGKGEKERVGKEFACSAGDPGSIPGLGRSPGEGNGQPTPVSLPGKSHGQRSLVGCSPCGRKESGTTERLTLTYLQGTRSCVLQQRPGTAKLTQTKQNTLS